MPSILPVRRVRRGRPPCASTPSLTACVPAAPSSPAKTPRNTSGFGPRSKPSGSPKPAQNGCIWNRCRPPNGLLARIARGESQIYEANIRPEEQFPLLREVATQRTRLERSFTSALRELKQLQKERKAQPRPQRQSKQTVQAQSPAQPLSYVMSEGAGDHQAFCATVTPDSR